VWPPLTNATGDRFAALNLFERMSYQGRVPVLHSRG
jgi:hypothetical protein